MEIVYNEEELLHYMENAVKINPEHPVLIDRYLTGKEVEVDAIRTVKTSLIPGIMEHIERAGVHSGDSIASLPAANDLPKPVKQNHMLIIRSDQIAKRHGNVVGLLNIQFVIV